MLDILTVSVFVIIIVGIFIVCILVLCSRTICGHRPCWRRPDPSTAGGSSVSERRGAGGGGGGGGGSGGGGGRRGTQEYGRSPGGLSPEPDHIPLDGYFDPAMLEGNIHGEPPPYQEVNSYKLPTYDEAIGTAAPAVSVDIGRDNVAFHIEADTDSEAAQPGSSAHAHNGGTGGKDHEVSPCERASCLQTEDQSSNTPGEVAEHLETICVESTSETEAGHNRSSSHGNESGEGHQRGAGHTAEPHDEGVPFLDAIRTDNTCDRNGFDDGGVVHNIPAVVP